VKTAISVIQKDILASVTIGKTTGNATIVTSIFQRAILVNARTEKTTGSATTVTNKSLLDTHANVETKNDEKNYLFFFIRTVLHLTVIM
jgi:hypothetical protein